MRVIFALTFGIVLWADPEQPVRLPHVGYWLLASYFACTVALLTIAWRSWWWDSQLALSAWLLDFAVFVVALYFTEGKSSDFISPYIGFFTFLVAAALLLWGWRRTAVLIPLLAACYVADGALLRALGLEVDLDRFARRSVYMILLTAMFIWFAASRGGPRPGRMRYGGLPAAAPISAVMETAAAYAATELGASCAAIAWHDPEEPWAEILEWRGGVIETRRLVPPPGDLLEMIPGADRPILFALHKNRTLCFASEDKIVLKRGVVECPFAAMVAASEGITFPIRSSEVEGRIVLWGIAGVCSDDVRTAEILRTEIESHVDRHSIATMHDRKAVNLLREAIARDLHDGVAQSLAGAAFRLERLRTTSASGGDLQAELIEAKNALRMEQQNVRGLIATLKADPSAEERVELGAQISEWLPAIAAGWGVQVELDAPAEPIFVGARSAHELRQLLREAIANAVHHGGAGLVTIALRRPGELVELVVTDDGGGFPPGESMRPWSILERVQLLGGSLAVDSSPDGAQLRVNIPAEVDA